MYDQNYPQPSSSGGIFRAFIDAVTKPSVQNFENLLQNPVVTPNNAYLWVAIASAIGGLVLALGNSIFNSQIRETIGMLIGFLVCSGPLSALVAVLAVVISAAVASAIARAFGGVGSYSQTVSLYGVISSPMLLINLVIGAIPFVNILTFFTGLYQVFLYIQAIRAAHKIDGLKAAIAALAIPVLTFCCALVIFVLFMSVFAVAFADVFSSIPGNLLP